MERADTLLFKRGIAPSRTVAQRLITSGSAQYLVKGEWTAVSKPGQKLDSATELRLVDDTELRYASRGGFKLREALRHSGLDLTGKVVLDIGQSTGGFTDCALQEGASLVVGVDSGHGQLASKLIDESRVVCLEGVNARDLPHDRLMGYTPAAGFDLIVMDLSFISQTLVIQGIASLLLNDGKVLALVKPQFEVGQEWIGKGGIVRDQGVYPELQQRITRCYEDNDFKVLDWFDSPIRGGDGNREFFIYAGRP